LDEQVRRSPTGFGLARTAVYISAILGFVGLTLALVGTYGALAFMVGQRTQEIGIRIALGANSMQVIGLVVRQGLQLTIGAGVAGVALGAAMGRLLRGFLFDVSPTEPFIVMAVIVILMLASVLTCAIPARKATAIDPILALKCE
jgi:ABC-type antimicrobial peptide transport system permease subunit